MGKGAVYVEREGLLLRTLLFPTEMTRYSSFKHDRFVP